MREIKLTQGLFAKVDDEDYEWLNQWKWCAHKCRNTFYAVRTVFINGRQTTLQMHGLIMGDNPLRLMIDHNDGDGSNNQKLNLQFCTNQENGMNRKKSKNCSSKYMGVRWNKLRQKWEVYIQVYGKYKYLGLFGIEEDAARAYDKAAVERNPNFKRLNFPENK